MSQMKGRVILAGYSPDLPDLVCVRALDRALASGLILAPSDLPRDLGNRSTVWVEEEQSIEEIDGLWQQLMETLDRGQTVLRWYPDNPLATSAGRRDAEALREAEVPIELIPTVPSEILAANFAGIQMPEPPRTLAASDEDSTSDYWVSGHADAAGIATVSISQPGTPDQSTDRNLTEPYSLSIGGAGAEQRIQPNWFESLPLFGKRILVTRTIHQAPALSRTLRELGAEPVELPAIDIIPDPFPEMSQQAADDLPGYDWVIFTSTNGVEVFMEKLRQSGYDARHFRNAKVAAIGNATGERLRRNFIQPDFVPDEFVAEGIINGLGELGIQGARILIPRAEIARTALPDGLRERGAMVDVVPVYRTIRGTPDPLVIDRIDAGEIDIVTFTSSSTVTNLIDMLDGDASRLNSVVIACIGPITEATAREHGLEVEVTAGEYSIPGLIDALCAIREEIDA
jgi:uroporphyrinogen-III synthase